MSDLETRIKVTAKNETKGAFAEASAGLKNLSKDASGLAKILGGAAVAGLAGMTALLYDAAKGASEMQVSVAKMDATLNSMVGTTMDVATGLTKTSTSMKVTGIEADAMRLSMDNANIAIKDQQLKMKELKDRLDDGKISREKFNLEMKKSENQIQMLSLKVTDYNNKLGESETSQVALTRKVTLTGDALKKAREEILKSSEAAVKLGFDDEAAALSITRLFQRTGDLTEATRLNNIAMDLARAKSMDLEAASNAVGMVLSGNGKILKQFGIEVDETKTPMQQLIELQSKLNGQASAFAQTFPGQMMVLQESWSNLKDIVGLALLESIQPFITQLTTWANDPAVQEQVKDISKTISEFANVSIPIAIESLQKFWNVLSGIYDTMILVGEAVTKLINKIWDLADAINNSKVLGSISGATAGAKNKTTGVSASSALSSLGSIFRAEGGPVTGNSPYIVGEKGPELFVPNSSGKIIPNGAGGTTVNIYNPVLLDDRMVSQMTTQIARMLKQDFRY